MEYRLVQSLCCTPESNVTLCVNNTSKKKKEKKEYSWLHRASLLSVVIREYDGRSEELRKITNLIMEMEINRNIW